MVTNFERGVVVKKRSLQVIDSHSVNATLFAVELDPVQVHHSGEDSQLNIALENTRLQ